MTIPFSVLPDFTDFRKRKKNRIRFISRRIYSSIHKNSSKQIFDFFLMEKCQNKNVFTWKKMRENRFYIVVRCWFLESLIIIVCYWSQLSWSRIGNKAGWVVLSKLSPLKLICQKVRIKAAVSMFSHVSSSFASLFRVYNLVMLFSTWCDWYILLVWNILFVVTRKFCRFLERFVEVCGL